MFIKYHCLIVEEIQPNIFIRTIKEKVISNIMDGFVLVKVFYSALNYKDALSARGHKGITRKYPHTPGIDASGKVVESKCDKFKSGDEVLVTGYDLGMNTDGGFAEYICVPSDWVVPLPSGLSLRESMIFGTAGFTAALCIDEFKKHDILPENEGKILVTGASGGVGSLSVALLSKLNYNVVASTGKKEKNEFLIKIGANEVISRQEVREESQKYLLQKKWLAAIDNVGGITLSTIIRSLEQHGVVCSVGLVESDQFLISVYPFILRGVKIVGIDSAEQRMDRRLKLWQLLAKEWKPNNLDILTNEITLNDVSPEIDRILKGEQTGRVLINMQN